MNPVLILTAAGFAAGVTAAVLYGLRYGWSALLEWRPVWVKRPPRHRGRHYRKPHDRVTSVPTHMTTVRIPLRHHDGPRRRP